MYLEITNIWTDNDLDSEIRHGKYRVQMLFNMDLGRHLHKMEMILERTLHLSAKFCDCLGVHVSYTWSRALRFRLPYLFQVLSFSAHCTIHPSTFKPQTLYPVIKLLSGLKEIVTPYVLEMAEKTKILLLGSTGYMHVFLLLVMTAQY